MKENKVERQFGKGAGQGLARPGPAEPARPSKGLILPYSPLSPLIEDVPHSAQALRGAPNSIAPRIPPGLPLAMRNGQTIIDRGHRHRYGKCEIGNGKWDIYRTSPEQPTNIDQKLIEHPLEIH